MARAHQNLDIYVDGKLMYERAVVQDDMRHGHVSVKARRAGGIGVATAITLSEVTSEKGPEKGSWQWTGVNADGDTVVITGIPQRKTCCGA